MSGASCDEKSEGERGEVKTHPSIRNSEAYGGPSSFPDSVGRTNKTMMNRVKISYKSLSRECACVFRTHTRAPRDRLGLRARVPKRGSLEGGSSVSVKRSSKREYISFRLPASTYTVHSSFESGRERFRLPA